MTPSKTTRIFGILLNIGLISSSISKLQPSPIPMSTPYRNDQPVIYMSAFYDPKYHDDGRRPTAVETFEESNLIIPPAANPTTRAYTREEKATILQKYKATQSDKPKRGIANSVDFTGDGDSLAVESRDNLAMESESPAIVIKAKDASKDEKNSKDQVQVESNKHKTEPLKPTLKPHHPQTYYGHNHQGVVHVNSYLRQSKDEFLHGRRKFRAYYVRPHKTPSFGNVFLEMRSNIGYW